MNHFVSILILATLLLSGCDETPPAAQDSPTQASSETIVQQETTLAETTVQIVPSFDLDKKLTNSDLYDVSRERLREMRNEYYARRGYIFKSEDLREKFAAMGYPATEEDVSELLTDLDKRNIQTIREAEQYVTRTDQALSVSDFDYGADVADEFNLFLKGLLEKAHNGDTRYLETILVEDSDVSTDMLKNDLGNLQVSTEATKVTYSVERCDAHCMMCTETLPEESGNEMYQVELFWEYLEADAGRDGSAIIYTFAKVEDEYKVVCIFAAG